MVEVSEEVWFFALPRTAMIETCKLSLSFDPSPLVSDLDLIRPDEWIPHFNTGYHEGGWSGVALRASGGDARQLYPNPRSDHAVADTEILQRCGNLHALMAKFECAISSARLLRLAAGAVIKEHRDFDLGLETGEVRLHIPITTNPNVEFFLAGTRVEMQPGECWYLDFTLPHRVVNHGATDRIHLVIDCKLNDWLKAKFPFDFDASTTAEMEAQPAHSSPADFELFRQAVLKDPALHQRLRQTDDRAAFARLAVNIGDELGYRFSEGDVEEAIRAARRAWLQRWVE